MKKKMLPLIICHLCPLPPPDSYLNTSLVRANACIVRTKQWYIQRRKCHVLVGCALKHTHKVRVISFYDFETKSYTDDDVFLLDLGSQRPSGDG